MTESVVSTRPFEGLQIPVAGTYALDPAHKRVGFIARHMMVAKVRGQFAEASATITVGEDPLQSSVTATITTASIETGTVDRDNHLRSGDFFESEKYPTMEFRSTGIKEHAGAEFVLDGELTIKGITKQVELTVEFEGAATHPSGKPVFGFSAHTEIDREDWGLTWNMAVEGGGVLVGRKVKIEIEGEAVLQG
ncbi:YceI family protein [Actinoplanes sp. TBRC 11911]|uniref:YceI family protein n=1 Tax=Actinoplanes sp. TBRC 11911 TaxID=2729386 RepID=UPI00145F287A|nr:YceI family protein [Actinoplanes sp. TBRC 11911]NMO56785.1 YceI family protein [Actinoplanes sp. TBRC 11911]